MPFDFSESDFRGAKGHYRQGHTRPGPGRSSKYQRCYPYMAERLARIGCTDSQIASVLGVGRTTYYRWLKQHTAFRDSIQRGKAIADAVVVNALYQLAVGYSVTIEHALLSNGKLVPLEKHIPPSLKAIKFWLRNRQPHLWRF